MEFAVAQVAAGGGSASGEGSFPHFVLVCGREAEGEPGPDPGFSYDCGPDGRFVRPASDVGGPAAGPPRMAGSSARRTAAGGAGRLIVWGCGDSGRLGLGPPFAAQRRPVLMAHAYLEVAERWASVCPHASVWARVCPTGVDGARVSGGSGALGVCLSA